MKTRVLIIIGIVGLGAAFYVSMFTTIFHFEPKMTLQEFHERFDDENIVRHFKSTYPEHYAGWGKSPGMASPTWGYGAVNESLIAELRVKENFGKYEFVYTCGNIGNDWQSHVMIRNASVDDIENNRCFTTDSGNLKTLEDLKCKQIGGNPNHPEYEGCVLDTIICGFDSEGVPVYEGCQTSRQMCRELGGKIVETLSCKESIKEKYAPDPAPCEFRGPSGCEFPE